MSDVTGLTGSGGGTKIRITGMASGLDVDAMVKKMMAAEQVKVDKAKQDQQTIQWKQEAYQDIIKDIKDLQSSFFDSASSDKNILSSANLAGFDTIITSSDTSALSVMAGAGAKSGNYSVSFTKPTASDVDGQLAVAAVKSGEVINRSVSTTMSELGWSSGNITFKYNGSTTDTSITVASTDKISDIITKISAASGSAVTASFDESTGQFTMKATQSMQVTSDFSPLGLTNDTAALTVAKIGTGINPNLSTTMSNLGCSSGNITFKYNGNATNTTVAINGTDKISDIIGKISAASGGAVTASFSQLTGKFTLQTVATGSNQSLQVTSDFSPLGLKSDASASLGNDAIVYITPPGGTTAIKVVKSTNNFTIDGITYNLQKKVDTNFSATQNSSKVYDKIKGYLDKYNAIVDKIQTKLTEKKDYNYKPLTDAQKESMKDTEITSWESKAKKGILKNDENLQNMLNDLRSAFTTSVKGVNISMGKYGDSSIGLDFSSDYTQSEHIDITDPSKLKDAIATKGDQILKFFTNVSTNTSVNKDGKTEGYHESGVFARIKNILENNAGYTNTSLNTSILTKYANKQDDYSKFGTSGNNTLPDQIYQKQLLINKLNESLSDKQESYYQKFSKLETVMNNLNSQQSWLSQQFGG